VSNAVESFAEIERDNDHIVIADQQSSSAATIPLLPISIDIDRCFQKYRDIDIDIVSQ